MYTTVEATYESGVLKLHEPLPLDEHTIVGVTVETDEAPSVPADELSDFSENEMLDIVLTVLPSPAATTGTATRGEPILPKPFEIAQSDLTPQ